MSNKISIKDEARNLLSFLLVHHSVDTEEYALLMEALAQPPLPVQPVQETLNEAAIRKRGVTTHCQCEACKNGNIHDSDCSVHNGDALPVGPCDCSLAAPPLPVQEDSCFCHSGVSLQSVSGGAAPEGYLGKVTLLIDGELVDYVKEQPPLPEPLEYWNAVEGWVKIESQGELK